MWPDDDNVVLDRDGELLAHLAEAGARAWRLLPGEHRECEGAWRRVYGHAFRRPLRHRHGERAVQEFLGQPATRWLVVPFLSDVPGTPVRVRGPRMSAFECDGSPVALGAFGDVEFFVSPPDLQWTFVRTHEDFALGGPFFVRSEWLDERGGPGGVGPIGERDYWVDLEFRVCRELAGLSDKARRALWCDGFAPENFILDGEGARVTGRVWIARGSRGQERWRFVLLAGRDVPSWGGVDWYALLPLEHVTGWLSLDAHRKTMKIDPAAAYPDRPRAAR